MLRLDHYPVLDKIPAPGSAKDRYRAFRSKIPEGKKGNWSVQRFTIEVDFQLLRLMRDGRGTPPGTYTRLCRGNTVIMSDTDAEIDDHQDAYRNATGRVLIHGLGLGVFLTMVLSKPAVKKVDVIELSQDVIDLVGSSFATDPRVTIHQGDCRTFEWPRGTKFDLVWHDIWDNICGNNLPEMKALKKRFARKTKWQGCWAEEWIR